jgi:hypothetical protein
MNICILGSCRLRLDENHPELTKKKYKFEFNLISNRFTSNRFASNRFTSNRFTSNRSTSNRSTSNRFRSTGRHYNIYIDPINYVITPKDAYYSLYILNNPHLLDRMENKYKKELIKYTFWNDSLKTPKFILDCKKFDVLVIEISSIRTLINTKHYIPYKVLDKTIKYDVSSLTDKEFSYYLAELKKYCNKIIIFGPLLPNRLRQRLPQKTIDYREHVTALIKGVKDVCYIDWSGIIDELGYQKCMKSQYHFTDYFIKIYTKMLLVWIDKISKTTF